MWWMVVMAFGQDAVDDEDYDADAERAWILKSTPKLAKILCDGAPDEHLSGPSPEPLPMQGRTYIGCRARTAAMLTEHIEAGSKDMLYNELDAIREFAPANARKPERVAATVERLMRYVDNSWGPG